MTPCAMTWPCRRLELEAAGSAVATAAQKAETAKLVQLRRDNKRQLRRDNKRLTEEVEVLRRASAFFVMTSPVSRVGPEHIKDRHR